MPSDARQALFDNLVKLDKTFLLLRRQVLRKLGLTANQGEVLLVICTGANCVGDVAETLKISSSAATQVIESIEEKGLLRRIRSPEDRRIVKVELTPEGEALIGEITALKCNLASGILASLTDEEIRCVGTVHKKVILQAEHLLNELRESENKLRD